MGRLGGFCDFRVKVIILLMIIRRVGRRGEKEDLVFVNFC